MLWDFWQSLTKTRYTDRLGRMWQYDWMVYQNWFQTTPDA